MGISKGNCSLLQSFATCERARETMAELAWEMPLERRFSVEKPKRSYISTTAQKAGNAKTSECTFISLGIYSMSCLLPFSGYFPTVKNCSYYRSLWPARGT